jgi:uncharacterized hydrophobic protein (TIGR00271 family)
MSVGERPHPDRMATGGSSRWSSDEVLQLRAYVPPERAASVGHQLSAVAGVRHVIVGARTAGNMVQITSELDSDVADVVLALLHDCDLAGDDVVLWRTTSIRPIGWRRRRSRSGRDSAIWAEVTGRAAEHARTALLYVLFMAAAGVVAGVGVLDGSAILVVGAMALSPDLLPISAAAVGLVERRWELAARAALTLAVGLGIAALAAAGATLLLRGFGRIDSGLDLADTALGPSLTEVGPGTVLVALAAGMAGMLAYETATGTAVGVAISVTTIPAVAYAGCAIGLGSGTDAGGAIEVLATNVLSIVAGSTATLAVQRHQRPTTSATRGIAHDAER